MLQQTSAPKQFFNADYNMVLSPGKDALTSTAADEGGAGALTRHKEGYKTVETLVGGYLPSIPQVPLSM